MNLGTDVSSRDGWLLFVSSCKRLTMSWYRLDMTKPILYTIVYHPFSISKSLTLRLQEDFSVQIGLYGTNLHKNIALPKFPLQTFFTGHSGSWQILFCSSQLLICWPNFPRGIVSLHPENTLGTFSKLQFCVCTLKSLNLNCSLQPLPSHGHFNWISWMTLFSVLFGCKIVDPASPQMGHVLVCFPSAISTAHLLQKECPQCMSVGSHIILLQCLQINPLWTSLRFNTNFSAWGNTPSILRFNISNRKRKTTVILKILSKLYWRGCCYLWY